MYPARVHDARTKSDALGGIVISANDKHLKTPPRQLHQKAVKKLNGICRRNTFVVYVTCNDYAIGFFLIYNPDYLI